MKETLNFWRAQYRISCNRVLGDFITYLGKGGKKGLEFIQSNRDLMKTICEASGQKNISSDVICDRIHKHSAPSESKEWFYVKAMGLVSEINRILKTKWTLTVADAELQGVDLTTTTPNTVIYTLLEERVIDVVSEEATSEETTSEECSDVEELSSLTKSALCEKAKELNFPENEWVNLKKSELIEYLTGYLTQKTCEGHF